MKRNRFASNQDIHKTIEQLFDSSDCVFWKHFQHSSPIVSYRILQIIRLILRRGQSVIQWLQGSSRRADTMAYHQTVISQYQQALIKVRFLHQP